MCGVDCSSIQHSNWTSGGLASTGLDPAFALHLTLLLLGICVRGTTPEGFTAIDRMADAGDVENSRQIRMALTTHCAAGLPVHWLRCQRPSLTAYRATQLNAARSQDDQLPTSMAMAVDDRIMHSLMSVAEAEQTPLDRRSAALAQMKLPTKIGGGGATAAEPLAGVCWVSSFLACLAAHVQMVPHLQPS